jgi:hypothetical protein
MKKFIVAISLFLALTVNSFAGQYIKVYDIRDMGFYNIETFINKMIQIEQNGVMNPTLINVCCTDKIIILTFSKR